MVVYEDALNSLKETSRTFAIPISRLPCGLREAVMSGYLCLRAIDEVEDHPELDNPTKAALLRAISRTLQTRFDDGDLPAVLHSHRHALPDVTLRVGDWATGRLGATRAHDHRSAYMGGHGGDGRSHGALGRQRLDDSDRGGPRPLHV